MNRMFKGTKELVFGMLKFKPEQKNMVYDFINRELCIDLKKSCDKMLKLKFYFNERLDLVKIDYVEFFENKLIIEQTFEGYYIEFQKLMKNYE